MIETKRRSKRGSTTKVIKPETTRPRIHSSHGAHLVERDRAHIPRASPSASSLDNGGASLRGDPPRKRTPKPTNLNRDVGHGPRLRKGKAMPAMPPESLATDSSRELAVAIAAAAIDKKAVGLEVLDVAGKVDYADFLVLMTGRSDRQVQALAQGIEEALRAKGRRPLSVEGLPHASWVLMDFGDVVVHVFQDDARSSYDLDGLWMDARRIPVPIPDELR